MNQELELTNEELDKELGTGSDVSSYRTITIDNGVDIAGTGATGDFVEKEYNSETGKVERSSFADKFSGVILSVRGVITDKGKNKSWFTGEFNPLNPDDEIPLFLVNNDGNIKKDDDGNAITRWGTVNQLKANCSTKKPNGEMERNYEYWFIVYIEIENEVIKLKFKGTGRGNYINYKKQLSKLGYKPYQVYTSFFTKKDPEANNKFQVFFAVEENENGEIKLSDNNKIYQKRLMLYKESKSKLKSLPSPEESVEERQIEEPESPEEVEMNRQETQQAPEPMQQAPEPMQGESEVEDDDKIKIEQVPFD